MKFKIKTRRLQTSYYSIAINFEFFFDGYTARLGTVCEEKELSLSLFRTLYKEFLRMAKEKDKSYAN